MQNGDKSLSRIAIYMRECRGGKTYREFSDEIDKLFSYSYLAMMESGERISTQKKFVEFATTKAPADFRLSEDDAVRMWVDGKILFERNKAWKNRIAELREQGAGYRVKRNDS